MGEPSPIWKFGRGVLIRSVVWATLIWGINTWGVYDRARGSGAGVLAAIGAALGNLVVWPIFYVVVLPFVGFAAFMWQARKFGWNLGKQLTSSAGSQQSPSGSVGTSTTQAKDPIR